MLRQPSFWRTLLRLAGRVLLVLLLAPLLLILIYRFVPVPVTPLMLIRALEGEGMRMLWVDYDQLSPNLRRAVIASEDAKFCRHHGFDFAEIESAWRVYRAGGKLRGGSTITQQTAKNLLLWPGHNWLRKALEIYPTVLLEALWPKRRILQAYLDVIEWGPGIYGAEAAAQAYFRHSARTLSPEEAALMAAVLPNPLHWSPARPTAYIRHRAATIAARMAAAPEDCR